MGEGSCEHSHILQHSYLRCEFFPHPFRSLSPPSGEAVGMGGAGTEVIRTYTGILDSISCLTISSPYSSSRERSVSTRGNKGSLK